MEKIEQFADACQNNKVREVKKMISKGVDINGVNKYGYTGLALAMSNGNTEVVRILLSCSNIKIKGEQKKTSQSFFTITRSNFSQILKSWTFINSSSSWLFKNVQNH